MASNRGIEPLFESKFAAFLWGLMLGCLIGMFGLAFIYMVIV